MESESSKILSFPQNTAQPCIEAYQQACLAHLPPGTVAVYVSILRQFTQWVTERTKTREAFQPNALTSSMVERYLLNLSTQGYSFSHYKRVKSVRSTFVNGLLMNKERFPRIQYVG